MNWQARQNAFYSMTRDFERHVCILVEEYRPRVTDGSRMVAKPLEFELVEDSRICDPTIDINRADAQALMDSLWRIGLRPTEGEGSAGSLKATQEHLADMRGIALDLVKRALP